MANKTPILIAALGFAIAIQLFSCNNEPNSQYNIYAENLDFYEGKQVTFQLYENPGQASNDTTKLTATIKDGAFSFTGDANIIKMGDMSIEDAQGKSLYSRYIVLEPGTLNLKIDDKNRLLAQGDNLNTKAIDSWLYNKKADSLLEVIKSMQKLPEKKRNHPKYDAFRKKYNALLKQRRKIIISIIKDLAFNSENDIIPLIVALNRGYGLTTEEYKQILGNTTESPEKAFLIKQLKGKIELIENMAAKTGDHMIGKTIEDFSVNDINGVSRNLSKVISKNKYTLVEFWASWCAPCRAEIPHMKKVYATYKSKGFEIFSYSLDHKEDAWKKASKEENLSWINTSDLLAKKSPIVKSFAVIGIPRNYLVDSQGKIVAIDLRQEQLEEKIEALLPE